MILYILINTFFSYCHQYHKLQKGKTLSTEYFSQISMLTLLFQNYNQVKRPPNLKLALIYFDTFNFVCPKYKRGIKVMCSFITPELKPQPWWYHILRITPSFGMTQIAWNRVTKLGTNSEYTGVR